MLTSAFGPASRAEVALTVLMIYRWRLSFGAYHTTYRLIDDDGKLLDASVEVEGAELVFHSRGGRRGAVGARNLDYGTALRLLLERIELSPLRLEDVRLDSREVQDLPDQERSLVTLGDRSASSTELFAIISRRMQVFGHAPDAPYGGSRFKRIRLILSEPTNLSHGSLLACLGLKQIAAQEPTELDPPPFEVWLAVSQLIDDPGPKDKLSRSFDLIGADHRRVDPDRAIALARSLTGRRPTRVASGVSTHAILKAYGYQVVPRGDPGSSVAQPLPPMDVAWCEGNSVLSLHVY